MNFVKNDQLKENNELVKERHINQIIFEINVELKDILQRLNIIEQYLEIGDYHGD